MHVSALALVALCLSTARAEPDQRFYLVSGSDSFTIGAGDVRSDVTYAGTESVSWTTRNRVKRFVAHADYQRTEEGTSRPATATFVSEISGAGEQHDRVAQDPDYLTALNQPFAIQLDPSTLADLRRLHGTVPFDFASPMTASMLRGHLERIADGSIDGFSAIGVRFVAGGSLRGGLPDRSGLELDGTIDMHGNAYYAIADGLLLGLDATLTISGKLRNRAVSDPVSIEYRREFRAAKPAASAPAPSPS